MTFVRRITTQGWRKINILQCDEYRGMNGPDDDGKCEMTDMYLYRKCVPAPPKAQVVEYEPA